MTRATRKPSRITVSVVLLDPAWTKLLPGVERLVRKAARADVGEVVGVALKLDREPRELPVPPDLQAALGKRRILQREFDGLPPGQRRQSLLYLSAAKAPETRRKRLARLAEVLLERALLRQPKPTKKRKPRG